MTEKEINNIIESNDTENLNFYLSILLQKANQLDKERNWLSLAMLILFLIYHLADYKASGSIQIGPITLNDVNSIKIFIPLVFSFSMLRYVIVSSHKAELQNIVRIFSYKHFNFNSSPSDIIFIDDFTRTLMPISNHEELNKFTFKSKPGCGSFLLLLPLVGIMILPIIVLIYWLYPQILVFKTLNLISKASLLFTVWIILLIIFYIVKSMIIGAKENQRATDLMG